MYLLPTPKKIDIKDGFFAISSNISIVSVSALLFSNTGWKLPHILKDTIKRWTGIDVLINNERSYGRDILLKIKKNLTKQTYELKITEDGILIEGGSRQAVGYGIITLCQLIKTEGAYLPSLEILDSPDIENRGFYLDQARGRVLKLDRLKSLIDELVFYKINQFQIYIEQSFLFKGYSEMWRDDTPFTPEDIIELDRYCVERDIELVPSIASFGHLYELLKTKSFGEFCELSVDPAAEFSPLEKMMHHTIDVSNEKSFGLIRNMLEQFLPLFSSKFVNICADETFDLGLGKSQKLGIEKDRLYLDFLKKLCDYISSVGKVTMFWGDIICKNPENISLLPKDTICLAWGYNANQSDNICKPIADVTKNFYLCPGILSWNTLIPKYSQAFSNIKIMSSYAKKYGAIGFLNTDWGDFLHINDVFFSTIGMIYGAVFSWDTSSSINEDELNKKISKQHYLNHNMQFVNLLMEASKEQLFDWWLAVLVFENLADEKQISETTMESLLDVHREVVRRILEFKNLSTRLEEAEEKLAKSKTAIKQLVNTVDSFYRKDFELVDIAIDGINLLNRVGRAIFIDGIKKEGMEIASELEIWYLNYKEGYKRTSRYGSLHRISKIVFWYADVLRGIRTTPFSVLD